MVEIGFSVMESDPTETEQLRPLVEAFEQQYRIRVKVIGIPWDGGWNEIVKFGIYGHGPDVSSIGTTWVGSLATMRALRPYTPSETQALGGANAFFESMWRSGFLLNDPTLWAVPWFGDTMMIYFWENMLEEAGIHDFNAAFSSDDTLMETLQKLRDHGMEYPLAINAVETTHSIQEASHWVWNAGGNFTNTDGSQVIFNQPAALAGFKKYFSLRPFISPVLLKKSLTGGALFINTGETAIHFAAPWLNSTLSRRQAHDGRRPGVAPLPGVVFTGGSSLAIWQHTLHPDEAFAWVRFLTTRPPNGPTKIYRDQVPARRDALQVPLLQNDFFHRTYAQYLESIQRGRSFPTMRLWGAIEDKLVIEISRIWAELFANPDQDLDECLHRHFDPLAQRLNTTLGN